MWQYDHDIPHNTKKLNLSNGNTSAFLMFIWQDHEPSMEDGPHCIHNIRHDVAICSNLNVH